MKGGFRIVAVALLALSGCLGDGGGVGTEGGAGNTTATGSEGSGDAANATESPEVGASWTTSHYLTRDLTFTTNASSFGEGDRVPINGIVDAMTQQDLTSFGTTRARDGRHLVFTDATLTFYYTRDAPAARDGTFPGFGAGWGFAEGSSVLALEEGPAAVAAGDIVEVTLSFDLPPGGLVFPPGAEVYAVLFHSYHPSPAAAAGYVLVENAQYPSRFDATSHYEPAPEGRWVETLREQGSLQGGECAGGPTDGSRATHAFDVGADVVGVQAHLVRTGGQGTNPDLDLDILGPGGDVVGGGHSPFAEEWATAHAPNIDAAGRGTWSVLVRACSAQTADYEVVVTTLVAAEAAAASDDSA